MVADLLTRLAGANLAASLAIVAVLVARRPMRDRFGAQSACRLWWAPLLSLTALLSGHEHPGLGRLIQAGASALVGQAGPARGEALLAVWLGGAAATAGVLAVRHAGFLRRARAGGAGPAMVGVLVPRMVAPADFARRFTGEERAIIRAHERGHVERAICA